MSSKKQSIIMISVVCVCFLLFNAVSIFSLMGMARENTKEINTMLAYRIYDTISSGLNEPISVSKTMACDNFLIDALKNEDSYTEEEAIEMMRRYLFSIKRGLDYDTTFVISEKSRRYYTYEGLNKIVDPVNDAHDIWYQNFIDKNEKYVLNVDNDEVNKGRWTVFVDIRVEDEDGTLLGVCGVGVKMTDLQKLFIECEREYNVKINMVDSNGLVQVDTDEINIENAYLDTEILDGKGTEEYIYQLTGKNDFSVVKHIEKLGWFLVVRSNSMGINTQFNNIILANVAISLFVTLIVLAITALIVRRSNIKDAIAERVSKQLSSTADIYVSLHEINFVDDTFVEVRNNYPEAAEMTVVSDKGCQEMIREVMTRVSDASSLDLILDFVDFSKLDERLKNRNTITTEFLSTANKWCRARYIVSERLADGRVSKAMYLIENIDDEKRKRDALINLSELAIAANEAKSSFLSNMSHEIRTPINAVLGMNEMILRECRDEDILVYAESIRTAGTTLLGLINDILDFSKIEAGKMEIIPVDYDLSVVISDLENMILMRAADKGLQFATEIAKDVPKYLNGDEVRVKQVVTNLLTNAVKYTDQGSITLSVDCERDANDRGCVLLHIAVRDTGIGIRQEDMDKLFAEFDRIEEKRNRNVEGTGLGLSITRHLLEMMDSTLSVESVYGSGSVFSFVLRQRVVKWEPIGDYAGSDHSAFAQIKTHRERFAAPDAIVLVVDDTAMNLKVFTNLLKRTRIQIDTAESGDECIRLASQKKYDMIFLDHMMPMKDGIETFREMQADADNPNRTTPTICLTANAISGARDRYINEGFTDYLTKPINSERLEEMLMEYLPAEKLLPPEVEELSERTKTAERMEPIEWAETAERTEMAERTETAASSSNEKTAEAVPNEKTTGAVPNGELAGAAPNGETDAGMIPGWLWECDEIDVQEGITNCVDEEFYLSMLEDFRASIDERIREIEGYFENEDLKNYTVKVHAAKSSARMVGANRLSEEARLLEAAGEEGDMDYIRAHTQEFFAHLRSMKELLSPLE